MQPIYPSTLCVISIKSRQHKKSRARKTAEKQLLEQELQLRKCPSMRDYVCVYSICVCVYSVSVCVCATGLAVCDLKSKCVQDDFVKDCKAVCRAAQLLSLG